MLPAMNRVGAPLLAMLVFGSLTRSRPDARSAGRESEN